MSQTSLFRTKEGRIIRKAAKMSAEEIAEDIGKKAKPGMQLSVTEVAYAYLGGSSTSTSPVARKAMEILVQKGKAKATGKKNMGNAAIYEITASFKKAESGDAAAYRAYFQKKLKEWDIQSPADLDDAKKKKFFDEVNDGWTSDDEKKGSPPPNADATCGCGCSGGARKAALNPGAKLEDLTREQQIVLWATYGFKPSYPPVGKHIRFYEAWKATGITQEEWGKAQKELVTHRVLASNGALTPQAKQLIKAVGGEHAQSALRKLAKSGWSNPSYEERSKMENKLNAVN